MIEIAVLLLVLAVTVSMTGLYYSVYLVLKRLTEFPPLPKVSASTTSDTPSYTFTGSVQDSYTPEGSDLTVPIEDFHPSAKRPIKVVYEDEEDRITPVDEDGPKA
jgi:hypothetical protein